MYVFNKEIAPVTKTVPLNTVCCMVAKIRYLVVECILAICQSGIGIVLLSPAENPEREEKTYFTSFRDHL